MVSNARNLSRLLGSSTSLNPDFTSDLGGGVTPVALAINLPVVGNTAGDMIFVEETKALYVWDGTEWDRVFSGPSEIPVWTNSFDSAYDLSNTGQVTTITVSATDPEGFPITYSYDTNPTNQTQCTIIQSGDTFTLTPSVNDSDAGSFSLRFKASDGLHYTSHTVPVNLVFAQSIVFNTTNPPQSDQIVYVYSSTSGNLNTLPLRTGKNYFEVILNSGAVYGMIGISIEGFVGNYTDGSGDGWWLYQNGSIYPNGSVSSGLGSWTTNDVLMIAYDTSASKVWFGRNGTWQNSVDPSTGQGGQTITTSGVPYQFMIGSGSTGGTSWNATLTTGSNSGLRTYSPPTGFKAH